LAFASNFFLVRLIWRFSTSGEKTKYAIYLKAENSELPDKIQLPTAFAGESAEIQLLGCEGKLQILTNDGVCSIKIPNSIKNDLANSPAMVFRFGDKTTQRN
jgi:hypothetical protein